jgi:hypothetical protein
MHKMGEGLILDEVRIEVGRQLRYPSPPNAADPAESREALTPRHIAAEPQSGAPARLAAWD